MAVKAFATVAAVFGSATLALSLSSAFVAPNGGFLQRSPAQFQASQQAEATFSSKAAACGVVGALGVALLFGRRASPAAARRSAVTVCAFEEELGVTPPLGFWDPLGLSKYEDAELNVLLFKRRRGVELQHGRVAMLATIGYIVPEFFKWPGYCAPSENLAFADVPNGLQALYKVPLVGWTQIIGFIGFLEVKNLSTLTEGKENIGDFDGFGAYGLPGGKSIDDPERKKKALNAEINNGRLAMMAIIGMFFQDGLTGSAWGDWATFEASPLRAFENELGVTPPMGFFDPLGMSKDGDAATFTRRRQAEIKNGRVAMWAAMGYIVPEYFRWPADLAPSKGITCADAPTGIAALTKLPVDGWAQIFAFIGFLELFPFRQEKDRAAGDFSGAGYLGVPWFFVAGREGSKCDPEKSKRSLNAEINNGRLAMMAITGMVAQNAFFDTTSSQMWLPGA